MKTLSGACAELRDGLRATLLPWLLAHVIVLAVCRRIGGGLFSPLFAWDTHWYLAEANGMAHGGNVFADFTGPGGLAHFFPLTSLCVAGLALVTRLPVTFLLFAFCWILAWVFGALVHMIAMRETRDRMTASRAAWLSQIAPGAFALVMGYTEPLAGVLAALYFLAIRRQRTGWAFAVGLLAGISRPTGIVLALPGLFEAIRAAHRARWAPRVIIAGLAQTASPALGLFTYLAYCQWHFGDWILPYAQQVSSGNRGAVTQNPFATIQTLMNTPNSTSILLTSLAGAAIGIFALTACWGLLPGSFTAWSAVMFILGITSPLFTSEPRYLAAIIPFCIALPELIRSRWVWIPFVVANLALLYSVTWLALTYRQIA
ncbi:MAG TPA: hypothetical protein VL551_30770 [Actinospica sp.]|jgi:hypothetical protein|nr:hypothetical protein [Actinospica sp.]